MRAAAVFDSKAREVLSGQRTWRSELARKLAEARSADRTLWFHTTSVGEFEQAKPVIAALHPDHRIVVTCFSPSVYQAIGRYPHADGSCYLPFDSRREVNALLDLVRPSAVVFSKFDVWPNCVWEASRRGIPVALIAGTMHAKSTRLIQPVRGLMQHVYPHLALLCAVTQEDAHRLRVLAGKGANIVVTGDTRFDQVEARARRSESEPLPTALEGWNGFTLIAGSTYAADEQVVIPAFVALRKQIPSSRLIVVPHEPTPSHVAMTQKALNRADLRSVCLSAVDARADARRADALIVDRVGLLARLYAASDAAFVGGSFHRRVHNVMEPAAFSKPVLVGPLTDNSSEAAGLRACGGSIAVTGSDDLAEALIRLAQDAERCHRIGTAGRQFIVVNLGASDRTLEALRAHVLPATTERR